MGPPKLVSFPYYSHKKPWNHPWECNIQGRYPYPCTPTNVPPMGKSQYEPYMVAIYGWKNPQESLENTINTMDTLGVHPLSLDPSQKPKIVLSSLFQVLALHSTDPIEMELVRSPALLRGHSYTVDDSGPNLRDHRSIPIYPHIVHSISKRYNWCTYVNIYIYVCVCKETKIFRYMMIHERKHIYT